jgi:cytochrome P450
MTFDRSRLNRFRGVDTQRLFNEYQGCEVDADPYEVFRTLRKQGDIVQVDLHDLLGIDPSIAVTVASSGYRDVDPSQVFAAVTFDAVSTILRMNGFDNSAHLKAHLPFLGKTVASMDGEEHRRNRSLVSAPFTKRSVEKKIDSIVQAVATQNAERLLARARAGTGEADLLDDFISDYPANVIVKILGLNDEDVLDFVHTAFAMVTFSDPGIAVEAGQVLYDWIADVAESKRRQPVTDELVSQLVHLEVGDDKLSTDEIAAFLRILFVGGFETTMKGLSNVLVGLLTTGQWNLLVEDRSLVPRAIDEGLRWETSVLGMPRMATCDHDLFGVKIPEGSAVMCFAASANHDERRWTDPERFDIMREPKQHVVFGMGPHVCIGMNLARAEMRTALNTLLDLAPEMSPLQGHEDDIRVRGLASRGPRAIPVQVNKVPAVA